MNDSDERISALTARVWRLEQALRAHGISLEEPAPPNRSSVPELPVTAPEAATPIPAPVAAPPVPPPSLPLPVAALAQSRARAQLFTATSASPAGTHSQSLENRIASQWFNRIGILAVLIAAAWFLKLAIDNHWIGPLGRILIGLLTGGALVAWSERFRSKGFPAFSYSLKAVGTGILYLSLWASFALYHLLPSIVAFAAMIIVTASNATMAWLQDAELLAAYAIVGSLATPVLLSTGENHQVALFTYLLVLDLAVLLLVMFKPWSRLLVAAFAGTVLYYIGWASEFYSADQLTSSVVFLVVFFLLFAIAPRLVLDHPERDPARDLWDQLVGTAMPLATAIFGFMGLYVLYDEAGYQDFGAWLAVLFAAFYLGLLNLPQRGRIHQSKPLLDALQLVAAVTFLTIAIPLKAHGRWITIGWLAEGAALVWIEGKVPSRLLNALSLICLALGLISTVVQNDLDAPTPLFNPRFGCYLAAIACAAAAAWLAHRRPPLPPVAHLIEPKAFVAACILVINLLILLAIGWEINTYWNSGLTYSPSTFGAMQMKSQLTYSAFFMLFGAILLALGFARRSAFLRWQALVLLSITILKVFLFDVSNLSQGFRILSFLALGALLLGVSFIYQRDLLHLRKAESTRSASSNEDQP